MEAAMWRIIFGFLWEVIVGKDVRPGKAYQRHKFRFVIFILVCISLGYNFITTKRLFVYYDAYTTLEKKYNELKIKAKQLEEDNRELEKIVVDSFKKSPKPNGRQNE